MDEADIDLVGGSAQGARGVKRPAESPSPSPSRPSKRKAGPLPRDVYVRRPSLSPSPSPPPSPAPIAPASPQPLADVTIKQENVPDEIPASVVPVNARPVDSVEDEPEQFNDLVIDMENHGTPEPVLAVLNNDSKPGKPTPQIDKTIPLTNHEESLEITRKIKVEDTDTNVRVNGDAIGKTSDVVYGLKLN